MLEVVYLTYKPFLLRLAHDADKTACFIYTMDNTIKHISLKIFGNVQGVFFRASTQKKAEELGLKGFVQNEKDGTVYLEAEGEPDALKQLERWAHQGPGRARVERVEVKELVSLAGFEKFEQRR